MRARDISGNCVRCGRPNPDPDRATCPPCIAKVRIYQERHRAGCKPAEGKPRAKYTPSKAKPVVLRGEAVDEFLLELIRGSNYGG